MRWHRFNPRNAAGDSAGGEHQEAGQKQKERASMHIRSASGSTVSYLKTHDCPDFSIARPIFRRRFCLQRHEIHGHLHQPLLSQSGAAGTWSQHAPDCGQGKTVNVTVVTPLDCISSTSHINVWSTSTDNGPDAQVPVGTIRMARASRSSETS